MADSETSTTLPVVSRRRMIGRTLAATAVTFLPPTKATQASVNAASDPAITAWREWQVAHKKTLALCRKQQRLETKLHRTVGLPQVSVRLPGVQDSVRITSLHDLDKIIDNYPTVAILNDDLSATTSSTGKRPTGSLAIPPPFRRRRLQQFTSSSWRKSSGQHRLRLSLALPSSSKP